MIPVKLNEKPLISISEADEFLRTNWHFTDPICLRELISYDCRTYLVECSKTPQAKYIFKICNAIESRNVRYFECLSKILQHSERNKLHVQRLIKSQNEKLILDFYESQYNCKADLEYSPLKSMLLSYIPGELLLNKTVTKDLCFLTGRELRRMTNCIDQLSLDLSYFVETTNDSLWNIKNALNARPLVNHFECEHKKSILTLVFDEFEQKILPNMNKFTTGFIHGDPNDMNIIINDKNEVYFIDWQDCGVSLKVYDLAILIFSLTYINHKFPGPLDIISIGNYCIEGYLDGDRSSLNELDIDLLPEIIQTRIGASVTIGYFSKKYLDPDNDYLLHTQNEGWIILEDLLKHKDHYRDKWKAAFLSVQSP